VQDSAQQEQIWQMRLPAMQQHTQQQHSTFAANNLSGKPAGVQTHAVSTKQSRQQACSDSTCRPGPRTRSASRISAGRDMLSGLNEQVEVSKKIATAAF
jgi:Tfp pilus assembly protein FimT